MNSGRKTRALGAAVAVAIALLCCGRVTEADDNGGPILVGNTAQTPPLIHFDMPNAIFNFGYDYEHDTNRQQSVTTGSTDNRSQETLNLLTDGYLLSPTFSDIKLSGLIGLQQESFEGPGVNHQTDGLLDGWDVSGTFLRDQIAPITLYTRRTEQIVTPNFSPSLDSVDTTYGGSIDIHYNALPTQLQVYQEDDSQKELDGTNEYEITEDVVHWHTDGANLKNQTLGWDYTFQNVGELEDDSPAIHYQNNQGSLNDVISFGRKDQSSLSSSLSGTDQTGDLAYQEVRLNETLLLQHTDTFQTHYNYTVDYTTISGIDQVSNELDAGFVHRLFESLTTSADAGGSILNESGGGGSGEVDQLFGRINFDYRKTAPLGLLLANLDLGWQWQYSPEGTTTTSVLNQANSFTNNQPIVLSQTNINTASIKVLSSTGVPYLLGKDFTVARSGNLVEIQRLVGGLIPLDGSVLLDYALLPQPANTTNTGDLGAGVRYEFQKSLLNGFAPYVRYSLQSQSIDTSQPSQFIPNSYHDITVGADYRIWHFSFNVEQDWHDSTLVPFDATRFSARFDQRLARETDFNITGNYAMLDYYAEHDYVNDASISATLQQKIGADWSVRAAVIYLNDRDELFGNTEGLEEQLELRWQHNQTEVYARLRNATLNANSVDSTFEVLEVGLTRRF